MNPLVIGSPRSDSTVEWGELVYPLTIDVKNHTHHTVVVPDAKAHIERHESGEVIFHNEAQLKRFIGDIQQLADLRQVNPYLTLSFRASSTSTTPSVPNEAVETVPSTDTASTVATDTAEPTAPVESKSKKGGKST